MLLGRVLSLVMVPVYTHHLGPADYGLLELLDTTDLLVIVAVSAAVADPVLRHYHDAPAGRPRDTVVSTAVVTLCLAGLLASLLGWAVSVPLAARMLHDPARADLLRLTFAAVLFQSVIEIPLAVLRADDRPLRFVAWTLARSVLGFALNITFVVQLHLGVRGMALSSLLSSALACVAMTAVTLRRTGLRFDPAVARAMLAFGWPMIPGALSLIAMQHARSYVLNAYAPLAVVGLWGLGLRAGSLITSALGSPLRNAWSAQMYSVWEAPDGRGPDRYRRAFTVFAGVYLWAAATLSAVSHELVALVAPQSYAAAAWVIPGVAFAYALKEMAEFFRGALVLGRNVRPVAYIEPAVALFDLGLGIALVSRFGLWGAVIAAPLTFAVYALALHSAARKVLPVRYEWSRVSALAAFALAVALPGMLLRTGNLAVDLAWKLSLASLFPVAAAALVFRAADERDFLSALRRKVTGW